MSNKTFHLSLIVIIILIGGWCLAEGKLYRECKRKPSGTILRHPLGCTHFIKCLDGVATTFYCPKGKLYSVANPPCDEAEKANCKDGSASTTTVSSSLTIPFTSTGMSKPVVPTIATVQTSLEISTPLETAVATIAKTRTTPSSIATTEISSQVPTTRTSSTRRRRTRTTPKMTQTTIDTTISVSVEASTQTASTSTSTKEPIPAQSLERGIKCPENETVDDVAFVPSNMNCTK